MSELPSDPMADDDDGTRRLEVVIPAALHRRLRVVAALEERSMAAVVIEVLAAYVDERTPPGI